jgi:hypothetical protein
MSKALFEGLVFDEVGNVTPVAFVGGEPTYVVIEDGFHFHVDARSVDDQVLDFMRKQVDGNRGLVSDGVLKMMGKDDLFTKAAVDSNLNNLDKNFAMLFEQGIPEQARQYLGMLGFRITINRRGEIIKLDDPTATDSGEE